jgi:ribonuclease VapC
MIKKRLSAAVIDTSAILCIALSEPAEKFFLDGFKRTDELFIGAATRAETWLAIYNIKGPEGAEMVDGLLAALKIKTVPFGEEPIPQFRQGGADYHHKHDDKARLNLGDLFTYSLAKKLNLPLFFQGADFKNTDLTNAMKALGYEMSVKGVPMMSQGIQR